MYKSLYILFVLCVFSVRMKELPEYIKKARCHIDENIEQCMKVNGNKILRQLISEGVPEFNLPSMNPLKVDFIQMINTPQLQVNVSKMEVHGLTEMTIIEAKAKPAEGVFKASLINKNITVVGKYTANGKILTFPVVGEGDFSIYLKNGLYNETVICRMVKRNGDDYLERMNIFLTANFERVVSDFRNLFNGNKQLGDQFNMLLNENWEYLISEYGPSVVQFLKNLMGNLFDSFTSNVPFKNLFLFD
ncbi:hypothetical protein HHI36_006659 [Cryptolaemus montrouzieri]|uniref:Uncharacterized protein n=1 Tax=Cryptolaemus montrouzieri TaxID=559131 RepID=A0ABD2NZ38_9CUCU